MSDAGGGDWMVTRDRTQAWEVETENEYETKDVMLSSWKVNSSAGQLQLNIKHSDKMHVRS